MWRLWFLCVNYAIQSKPNQDFIDQLERRDLINFFIIPLTSMSDQDRISPYNISTISIRRVIMIGKNINWGIISWSNTKFSKLTTHTRTVWQTVRRITNEILGVKCYMHPGSLAIFATTCFHSIRLLRFKYFWPSSEVVQPPCRIQFKNKSAAEHSVWIIPFNYVRQAVLHETTTLARQRFKCRASAEQNKTHKFC